MGGGGALLTLHSVALRELRAELKASFRDALFNLLEYSKYTLSSALGDADKVEGHAKGDATDKEYALEARRFQHFGLRTRPPKGTPAIRASVGGMTNSVILAEDPGDRYGPQDLEDGEAALYSTVEKCLIRLLKSGDITITSGDGKLVKLQGGGKGVVLKDMHADAGTFVFAFVPGPTATLSITYTDPDGKPTILGGGSGNVSVKVKLTEGSTVTESG